MPQSASSDAPKRAKCGLLRAWQMRRSSILPCRSASSGSPAGFDDGGLRAVGLEVGQPDPTKPISRLGAARPGSGDLSGDDSDRRLPVDASGSLWGAAAHPGEAARCESSSSNEAGLRTLLQFNARGRLSRLPRPASMGEGVCSRARPERSKVATSRRLERSARLPRSAGRRSLGGSCRRSASARCGA